MIRLQTFALEDGYDLALDLEPSPPRYDDALDLVASDCNTTANPHPLEECDRYDLIVGDYYCNPERSARVDLSPAFLTTTISAARAVTQGGGGEGQGQSEGQGIHTLTQVEAQGATACVPDGTYLAGVVEERFPGAAYERCASPDSCLERLKGGHCVLYADDELMLRYRAATDPDLEVTGEQFNTQFIVWPMSRAMDRGVADLLRRWIYAAIANATIDELGHSYFSVQLCPLGTAGERCELSCDPMGGRSDQAGRCVCNSARWAGDDCSVVVPEELNLYPDWLLGLCYFLFAFQTVACVACGGWLWWKRDAGQVRIAQPFFLALVLLGCFISTSSILALAQQDAGDGPVAGCAWFPWLFSVGFSVTFGTLNAKLLRVYRLFHSKEGSGRVRVTARETFNNIVAITSVDLLIVTVWTAVDQLHWVREVTSRDQFGEPLSSQGYCTADSWKSFVWPIATWHLLLLFFACGICYLTRKISSKFSEGKALALVMFSNLQILLISVPVLVIVGKDPTSSLFVQSMVIWLNDFAVVAIIFGNLIYSVHFAESEQS